MQDEVEIPTDAEFLIILEQALDDIDKLIDIMHVAPRDSYGDKEELDAYNKYNIIAQRIYSHQCNRYIKQNKPNDK